MIVLLFIKQLVGRRWQRHLGRTADGFGFPAKKYSHKHLSEGSIMHSTPCRLLVFTNRGKERTWPFTSCTHTLMKILLHTKFGGVNATLQSNQSVVCDFTRDDHFYLLPQSINGIAKNPGLSGHFLFWPVNIAHVTSPLVSQSTLNSLLSLANQTTVAAAGYGRPSISSSRALVNAVRSLVGSEMGQQRTKLGSQVDVGAVVPLQFGFTVPVLAVVDVEQASSDGVCLLLKPCRVVHLVLQTCTHMTENPVIYPQQTKICNP